MHDQFRQTISRFVQFPDADWEAMASLFKVRHLAKREHFCREGEICREVAFIVKGSFRQYYVVDGEERSTFFTFENGFVSDYDSFLTGQPSQMNLEALENAELIIVTKETMERLYRLYPKFETFGRLIAEDVYLCAMDRLRAFLLHSPEDRYRRFLQQHDAAVILERIPQHYIASYLGITPVSLSRIRNRVQRKKTVNV